jgi:hypothetical protein
MGFFLPRGFALFVRRPCGTHPLLSFSAAPVMVLRLLSRVLANEEEGWALSSPVTPFEVLHRLMTQEFTITSLLGYPSEVESVATLPDLLYEGS